MICSTRRLATVSQLNRSRSPRTTSRQRDAAVPTATRSWPPGVRAWSAARRAAMRRRFSASGFLPDVQRFGATFFNYVGRLAGLRAGPARARAASGTTGCASGSAPRPRPGTARSSCAASAARSSSRTAPREGTIHIVPVEGAPPTRARKRAGRLPGRHRRRGRHVCPPAEFDEHGRLTNRRRRSARSCPAGGAVKFEGYYNNPEATRTSVRGDDFHTGDLGYRDEDGFFYYSGRTDGWLRVDAGEPGQRPDRADRSAAIPASAACAVYAVPDPHTGDRVMAALETEAGSTRPVPRLPERAARPRVEVDAAAPPPRRRAAGHRDLGSAGQAAACVARAGRPRTSWSCGTGATGRSTTSAAGRSPRSSPSTGPTWTGRTPRSAHTAGFAQVRQLPPAEPGPRTHPGVGARARPRARRVELGRHHLQGRRRGRRGERAHRLPALPDAARRCTGDAAAHQRARLDLLRLPRARGGPGGRPAPVPLAARSPRACTRRCVPRRRPSP